MIDQPYRFPFLSQHTKLLEQIGELFFCLCLISVFFPLKIYPVFFGIGIVYYALISKKIILKTWAIALFIFLAYGIFSFSNYQGGSDLALVNFIKLCINLLFLYTASCWISGRENSKLIKHIDYSFHVIFILTCVQLLIYHQAWEFKLITGGSSSAEASRLYRARLFFWGLDDKNMFGARIALMGIPYILLPIIKKNTISWGRITAIFLLAHLSLSRTPVVALLIALALLLWFCVRKKWRILLVAGFLAGMLLIAQKLLRVDQLTTTRDGMGIRLIYWKTFFRDFDHISIWGNGFYSGGKFLDQYSPIYIGEPHIHNTFMTNYIDYGIIGFTAYFLFFAGFVVWCNKQQLNLNYWITVFVPVLSVMMILYTGYDDDLILYLILVSLLGFSKKIDFKTLKISF